MAANTPDQQVRWVHCSQKHLDVKYISIAYRLVCFNAAEKYFRVTCHILLAKCIEIQKDVLTVGSGMRPAYSFSPSNNSISMDIFCTRHTLKKFILFILFHTSVIK